MLITRFLQGEDQGLEGQGGWKEKRWIRPSLSGTWMSLLQRPPWPLPPTWVTRTHTFHRAPGLQRRLALTTLDRACLRSPLPPPHCGGQ